jgi:hypothetical protein
MLTRARVRRVVTIVTGTAAMAGLSACGESAITRARLEAALAPTFASLVEVQLLRMGLGPVPPPGIKAVANCRRISPGSRDAGAGEWSCTLTWTGPNHATLLDTFDVHAMPGGCYTASAADAEGHLGGPMIPTPDGTMTRNLLYVFDGCFDPSVTGVGRR